MIRLLLGMLLLVGCDTAVIHYDAPDASPDAEPAPVLTELHIGGPYIGTTGPCQMSGTYLNRTYTKLDTSRPHIGGISACEPLEDLGSVWKISCTYRTWNAWPWPWPWDWNHHTLYLDKYPEEGAMYKGAYVWWIETRCIEDENGIPCEWPEEWEWTCEHSFYIDDYTATYR